MHKFHLYIICILAMLSCNPKDTNAPGSNDAAAGKPVQTNAAPLARNLLQEYNFQHPTDIIKLPKELKEISGIRFINDSVLAMISDSKPDVFIYNIPQRIIEKQIRVASKGDFEDIEVIGNKIYVLQSNGVLWTIHQFAEEPRLESDTLPLQQPFELEGLSSNERKDSLYLAAKYWHKDDRVAEGQLPVWAWSVKNRTLSSAPVRLIPATVKSNKGVSEFHTSAIMPVYPSGYWLALSTNNKFLLQINPSGSLDSLEKLDDDIFVKPEGMAIAADGSLWISNEGKYDKATLLSFNKLKKEE